MKKRPHILGIDRGSKYIGLAYMDAVMQIPLPVGYIANDGSVFFVISDYLTRYNIQTIVVGYPGSAENSENIDSTSIALVKKNIDAFIKNIEFIIDAEKTKIHKINENYTSIQAGDIISNFKKNMAEDTVSAMFILERRKEGNSQI